MTDEPVLDPNALNRLREWGGEKLLGQMVRLFLENSPARMDQIRSGASGDLVDAEHGGHSLKSSAANLGATELSALAADVERTAAGADAQGVADLLPDLEAAYARAIEALEAVEKGEGA